jgi:spermidine/putrescine-binding protein
MKKRPTKPLGLALLAFLALFAPAPASAQNQELVIYTWPGMFPDTVLTSFEQENPGLKIVYKTFEFNEDMLMNLEIADGGAYDLVIADDYIIQMVIEEGLAQKLDKSKLPRLKNGVVNPIYQHQFYDPEDEYTIPYGAGAQTIVYDPSQVNREITGIADLWHSSLKNSVGITGNYRVINGMALKSLGKSMNTEDLADLRAAGERLKALAPNIRVVQDENLEEALIDGSISAALMYTDGVMKSKLQRPNLKVVFPKEGIGFGIMAAFIPRQAPNAEAAHKFLNFILDGRRGAQCFQELGYYCTFKDSEPYIMPNLRAYLILPDFTKMPQFNNNIEMLLNLSQEAEAEHTRIWKEFKALLDK